MTFSSETSKREWRHSPPLFLSLWLSTAACPSFLVCPSTVCLSNNAVSHSLLIQTEWLTVLKREGTHTAAGESFSEHSQWGFNTGISIRQSLMTLTNVFTNLCIREYCNESTIFLFLFFIPWQYIPIIYFHETQDQTTSLLSLSKMFYIVLFWGLFFYLYTSYQPY